MVRKILLFVFVILFVSSFVVASSSFKNSEIQTQYAQGDYLKGWINFSVSNENSNNLFTTSEGSSFTLKNLLDSQNINYDCFPSSCDKSYSATSPTLTKSFTLNGANARKKTFGFKITGKIDSINSAKFTLTSNVPNSCINQLEVDILDDGVLDVGNFNSASGSCPQTKSYGCFQSSHSSEFFRLDSPACQRINLSASPSFELGAFVKREVGQRDLKMDLFDSRYHNLGSCDLPNTLGVGQSGELSCIVNHLVVKSEAYYVCVRAVPGTDNDNRYLVKGYTEDSANSCGFSGIPSGSNDEELSFQIFATGRQFGNIGLVNFNDTLPNGEIFSHLIRDYIVDQYGSSMDCGNEGCVIPISLKGYFDQSVQLSNAEIVYRKSGATTTVNNFYDLSEQPVSITSDYKKINLDAMNLSLPSSYGEHNFRLSYEDVEVFDEDVEIAEIPIINYVFPTLVPAAVESLFFVNATSPNDANLTHYSWDFGNGVKKNSFSNQIRYAYNSTGNYTLKVTVFDEDDLNATRDFKINVGRPDAIANATLEEKFNQLKDLNVELNAYSDFEKEKLNSQLNVTDLDLRLKSIKRDYESAVSDVDYIAVVNKLSEVEIPLEVYSADSADNLVFIPSLNNVDLDVLDKIGGGYDSSISDEDYVNAINLWERDNFEMKISYEKINAVYQNNEANLLNVVTLNIKRVSGSEDAYLVLKKFKDLDFKGQYDEREEGNSVYFKLTGEEVTFSTTENVDFYDLPAYVTPALGRLNVVSEGVPICNEDKVCNGLENWRNCPGDCKPTKIIIWSLVGLLIFFFFAYIILQEWYKRNYENHLFQSKNFLFNILSYIHQEKIKGKNDGEIEVNLKKSGWNNEQITYAMRKYYGKRTGMFEIPMDWLFGMFSKKPMPRYEGRNQATLRPRM